ncbi:threonine/serine dehydratase [Streptomyces sp. NPDC001985]|uniref:threonine/serine dehydratase n=1 Tax=Streptomyces sp. NPDC001985 TaxID=3154406 RepID=UPI00332B8ECE
MHQSSQLSHEDVTAAAERIRGRVRPVAVTPLDSGVVPGPEAAEVWLGLEFLQHTGSFKARGALNFLLAHSEAGPLPDSGVAIASGGNAGLACAWAARSLGVRSTVFLPASAPPVKIARLAGYGADVRLVEGEYADAAEACAEFAGRSGALRSHAYDDPHVAAGAGTLLEELRAAIPGLDTVVVAVGGGGLFSGVATAARHHGMRTVAVEPEGSRALNAAMEAGRPVDVAVDSIAADALGARRVSETAVRVARDAGAVSVVVPDRGIAEARRVLWEEYRVVTEMSGAAALAGWGEFGVGVGERVAVVLCGANTNPSDLATPTS